ncbi:PREDICTED: scarecrow-like protein 22 isoform X2 [Tarenaya hassleriana]|uniref:scarecrow-like protein 22 isoform X1 n=1 Tax=Tarenaya hassleriana TaxID=28532 RepID=UPI00053C434F|nr:PREDICTED: scarecrow-like protein 22 isoform X1 [Tarenaya hassleriana]XP_010544619.1 PREDICTED: scarecrow-like protein 22 isoform X2 [Tarenaya hassleriana]
MPLPFEQFQGNGVLGLSSLCSDSPFQDKIWATSEEISDDFFHLVGNNGGFPEPTSVLDALRSPSPLASSTTTTLSSSHGGAAAASVADEKCGQICLEDLDGVLSGSPVQEQSILRLIMGDVGDPGPGFGALDPGFGFGSGSGSVIDGLNPLFTCGLPLQAAFQDQPIVPFEEKLQITNPEAVINQNPTLFFPVSSSPSSPPAKRLNLGQNGSQPDFHQSQKDFPFSDPGHDPFLSLRQQPPPRLAGDGQSAVIEQLFNAAELIGTGGDSVLAQGILARLNHHINNTVSDRKTPFQRAALYITEALQSLVLSGSAFSSSQNLILKIASYRAFSEASPFLQFVNFTANQAIIDSLEGFDRIHIIDFDVGFGSQWASLMQELVGRNRTPLPLKITAFASPSTVSDEFELRFAEESLKSFAGEVKIPFEIQLLGLDLLLNPAFWPLSLRSSDKEAIAVNLPISSVISGYLPLILRFLRQISPNVVVCSDRGCDRNDAPFPNAVIHALQYFTSLLESLDAANPSPDAAASIERIWLQPSMQRLLVNRHRWMERSPPWRSLLGQCGFTGASVSHAAEAQAECLVQRSGVRGFHVEKRQSSSSLVLCWERKELVSVSAWRC